MFTFKKILVYFVCRVGVGTGLPAMVCVRGSSLLLPFCGSLDLNAGHQAGTASPLSTALAGLPHGILLAASFGLERSSVTLKKNQVYDFISDGLFGVK